MRRVSLCGKSPPARPMSCQRDKGSRVVFQCNLNVVETIGNGAGTLEMARQIGQLAFQVRFGRRRKRKGFCKVLICSGEAEGGGGTLGQIHAHKAFGRAQTDIYTL